jgi:hypothetical protein
MDRNANVRVYKYEVPFEDEVRVSDLPPRGYAELLTVQVQRGVLCVWALVDLTHKGPKGRTLYVVGTGHPMPRHHGAYVGTVQTNDGGLVFHVFDEK